MLHGAHHSFGLGEWDIGPISLSPSISMKARVSGLHCNKVLTCQKKKKTNCFELQMCI